MSNYYKSELAKIKGPSFENTIVKITSPSAETKWLNLNDESAAELVKFLQDNFNLPENNNIVKILDFDIKEIPQDLLNCLDGYHSYKDMECDENIYSVQEIDDHDMLNAANLESYKVIAEKCNASGCGYFRLVSYN